MPRSNRVSGTGTAIASSKAVVPEGYKFDSRSQSRSGSSSAQRSGPGFETRLAKLENGNNGVSRSQSTRAGSSSGPGNQTLLRKVDQMQAQMNNMKLEAHNKEVEAKNEKIRDTEDRLRKAEDKLERAERPVYLVNNHIPYCTCYYCRGY